MIKALLSRLALYNINKPLAVLFSTTLKGSRKDLSRLSSRDFLSRWEGRINTDERARIQEILDVLDIQCYRADAPFPAEDVLLLGPLD